MDTFTEYYLKLWELIDIVLDLLQKELHKNALCLFSKWYTDVSIPRNTVNNLLNNNQYSNDS